MPLINDIRNDSNSKKAQEEDDNDLVVLHEVDNSELIAQLKLRLVGRRFNTERHSNEHLISSTTKQT